MEGLVALLLDGAGGARRLDRDELRRWKPRNGGLWVQVDPDDDEGKRWLFEEAGLAVGDRETLLRPVRQTHVEVLEGGALLFALRMYAPDTADLREARCFASADRLIAVTGDDFPALDMCSARLARGRGPRTVTELLATALHVGTDADEIAAVKLDQRVTDLEMQIQRNVRKSFEPLRVTWQMGAGLRRRLGAAREALVQLKQNGPPWLVGQQPDAWRDAIAHCSELVESVDAALDRLRALQTFTQNRLSNVLNDRLYLLTILSAIMMPLSFVTGLLGVNVGGIPARNAPWAFAALCILLCLLGVGEYFLLRRLRWVPSDVHPIQHPFTRPARGR